MQRPKTFLKIQKKIIMNQYKWYRFDGNDL